jgi:hypothetical protein
MTPNGRTHADAILEDADLDVVAIIVEGNQCRLKFFGQQAAAHAMAARNMSRLSADEDTDLTDWFELEALRTGLRQLAEENLALPQQAALPITDRWRDPFVFSQKLDGAFYGLAVQFIKRVAPSASLFVAGYHVRALHGRARPTHTGVRVTR